MLFEHGLVLAGRTTTVVRRLRSSSTLSTPPGSAIAKPLNEGLPVALPNPKRVVETDLVRPRTDVQTRARLKACPDWSRQPDEVLPRQPRPPTG